MNTNRFSKIITAALLAGTPLFWSACSDAWDDHYDVSEGGKVGELSLMENIKADPKLAPFFKVLQATGADNRLNAEQQYTVWAPLGLTEEQADSVIAVYQADEAEALAKGQKLNWEDNKAIAQFLHNQMALYAHPVSSLTDETISMMNKKYMHLKGSSDHSGTIGGTPFSEVVYSNNGILYKTESMQSFLPNIREYLTRCEGMDSVVKFIASFDEVKLDEDASVPGEIIDGKVHYLDSVTANTNRLLNAYGRIASEDSTYMFIAPTNQVWDELFPKYMKYFNYPQNVNNRDSIQMLNARMNIIGGRFFNTSFTNIYNRHPEDSLTNTSYYVNQQHNPRRNVFYKPNETLLNGLEKVDCSNGIVYIDNQTSGVIKERKTFFTKSDYSALSIFEIPKAKGQQDAADLTSSTVYWEEKDLEGNVLKEKSYRILQVNPKPGATGFNNRTITQASIHFNLPSTLSNVYYNIYAVMHPIPDSDLPSQFCVSYSLTDADGEYRLDGNSVPVFTKFLNPNPLSSSELTISSTQKAGEFFKASTERVDTMLIQSAVKFDFASYDGKEIVKLKFETDGTTTGRNKKYASTLCIVELILVPFEDEDEAKSVANDTYLFNDDYLEGKNEGTTNDEN